MSVYQRSDGRWVCKWRNPSRPEDKPWATRSFHTKEDADAFQDEVTQEERQCARLTVYEAVGLYLKDHNLSASVEQQYRWLVGGARQDQIRAKQKVGYAECIADRYVDSLDRRDLNAVRDCARAGGSSNVTINKWIDRLKAVFSYAVEEELITRNPWAHHRPLPVERRGSRQGTPEHFLAVYAHLQPWMQWACRTALALCLRPGKSELFSLQWKAFDFLHGAVTVFMGKVGMSKTVYPPQEYMEEALERYEADGRDDAQYVCRNSFGQRVRTYCHAWRDAVRKAGRGWLPFYSLRHIAATMMIAAGADVAAVAANLGHASPATTLNAYAHALPSAQKAASAVLGAAWCGTAKAIPEKSDG